MKLKFPLALLCCSRKFPGPWTSHSQEWAAPYLYSLESRQRPWGPWEAPLDPKLKETTSLLKIKNILSFTPSSLPKNISFSEICPHLLLCTCMAWLKPQPLSSKFLHSDSILHLTGLFWILNEVSVEEWGTAPGPIASWNGKGSQLSKHYMAFPSLSTPWGWYY